MKPKTNLFFLYYFAFANFIFGIKLWLIGSYGNATPYWDQWDAEGYNLYQPYLNGSLKLSSLFMPHGEHRILTTRLLALLELMVNGIWNPLLQMVVNAGLHIVFLVVVIALITRVIGRDYLPALLVFSALLFALPLGFENTLAGFQAQFYFVLLFSILCLWFTTTHDPFSLRWNFGLFSSILAFFSLASGIFCIGAAAAIGIIFYLLKLRRTRQQLVAVILLCGLFILGVALTPVLAEHQSMKASSLSQFIKALYHILWWPSPNKLLGLLQNGPVLIFFISMFLHRPVANDPKWFLIALIIWTFGVASGIAYGRAMDPLTSRYLDLFTISILINFSCLLIIFEELKETCKKCSYFGLIIWALYIGIALQAYNAGITQRELREYSEVKIDQEKNTKNYVATGNISNLKDKPFLHIPYPKPERLALLLDTLEIRSILPSNIAPPNRPIKEGRLDEGVNALLANYYIFIAVGLLSALIGCLTYFYRPQKTQLKNDC